MSEKHSCHSSIRHKHNKQNLDISSDTIYTCPMHPEVEKIGPGDCPICGMALESKDVSIKEDKTELIYMTRRFWICSALSLPILLLVMLDHLPGNPLAIYISSKNSPMD